MNFNYKGTVFGMFSKTVLDLMFTKFLGLPSGDYAVQIISLNDERGRDLGTATPAAWYSRNVRGATNVSSGFARIPDEKMEDLKMLIDNSSVDYRYVFCLTKTMTETLFSKFTETEDMPLLGLRLTESPRVAITQCWLCGKDIYRGDGRKILCTDHHIGSMNVQGYSSNNNGWQNVTKNSGNQPYLKKQLSFGFEFEVSNLTDSLRDEINYVLENKYGFLPTSDATVAVEWKSGIYKGFPPFYNNKNVFEFFDYCIDKNYIHVGENAGTHLHMATTDPEHPAFNNGAVYHKIMSDEAAARNLYRFIRYCEVALETAPHEWFEEVFGRHFTSYAKKFNQASQLYAGVFRQSERYSWMNFTQESHSGGRTKTVEFRLPRYRNRQQYVLAVKAGIALYEYSMEVLFKNGDPMTLATKFQNRVERLFRDKK